MSTGYSDTIRRWAADDRRTGSLPNADGTGEVGLGEDEAGRRLAVRFTLRLSGDRAETVRYQVFGCGFTIAACAAAAELAEGRTLAEIATISTTRVDSVLGGLPPERDYCAALAVEALQAALRSACSSQSTIIAVMAQDTDHAPLISADDPVYRLLIDSPAPRGAPASDRKLFAGLLAIAASESAAIAANIGLSVDELNDLLALYFPTVDIADLTTLSAPSTAPPPFAAPEIVELLLGYLSADRDGWAPITSLWLARSLATRAARPGHLWIAMGLFNRPELTAAIRRHLPALAAANDKGMRWKRFLYKQLCDRAGGVMCRTPNCGECGEYAVCFETPPHG